MREITAEEVREYLKPLLDREVDLDKVRRDLQIDKGSKSWDGIRVIMFRLAQEKVVKPSGKRDGIYKVLKPVKSVPIFSVVRERRPPFPLIFPKDFNTGMEMSFAEHVVIREGDCVLIPGMSNWGKTTLAMNFLAENIDYHPVLLGNEFTKGDEPTPRFLNRLDAIDWVEWVNSDGQDKFTLLSVYSDFADYVIKDRINIIDWVNLPGEYYMISAVMEGIKQAIGNGIAVVVLQKNPDIEYGRGGWMTKDFADLELLVDKHSETESRLTIGKVKEYTGHVTGRSWAYGIEKGVRIINLREVKRCLRCFGKKWRKQGMTSIPCENCRQTGFVDA